MDSPSILPICKEFHLRVDDILLGVGAIVPDSNSGREAAVSWANANDKRR